MPSSTFNFEREIPVLPWTRLAWVTAGLALAGLAAWEVTVRSWGYGPSVNDTPDLWADRREAVRPDSVVIVGDSRPHFDINLDEFEKGIGVRPIQLALDGSCAFPVLKNLADDPTFKGIVVASLVPGMWLAPGGPLLENSERAIKRYESRTLSDKSGHHLGMFLEERFAFLNDLDLKLDELLNHVPLPKRPGTGGPLLPPYFNTHTRERQAFMLDRVANPGPHQDRVKFGWIPLFTPPPKPSFIPAEAYEAGGKAAVEKRFKDTVEAVERIRARGGKVIFVRFPNSGELRKHEDKMTPRQFTWDRIIRETGAPGIHWEDYPELTGFECPEWSHLSAPDAVKFTRALVPHLKAAMDK